MLGFFMLFTKNPEKISIKSKKLNFADTGVDDDAFATLNYNNEFEAKFTWFKTNLDNTCLIKDQKV